MVERVCALCAGGTRALRRVVSLAVCAAMVLAMVPVTARAATSGTHGTDITWSLDGTVLTFSGTGAMTANPISGNSEWRSVTSVKIESGITTVGPYALAGCDKLVSVEIPSTVTRILYNAFENCTSLTSVTIPTGVTSIEKSAFFNCAGLTSVTIPDTVTSIGVNAFGNCTSLKSLTTSATKIGTSAFSGCTLLKQAVLKAPLEDCGSDIFGNCRDLETVELAEGTTTIGETMFFGCGNLMSIQIPDSVTTIGKQAFESALGSVTFSPSSKLTAIGEGAFRDSGIREIVIPETVTSIGDGAFSGGGGPSTVLKTVTFKGPPPSLASDVFNGATDLTIRYPYRYASEWDSVKNQDYGAISPTWTAYNETTAIVGGNCGAEGDGSNVQWEYDLTSHTLRIFGTGAMADYNPHYDSTTNPNPIPLPWDAYTGRESGQAIQTVIVDIGVTRIGNYAFDNCDDLSGVTIANTVREIGDYAFSGGNGPVLERINLPDSVISIGKGAFASTNLQEMVIPASVTSIGKDAFLACRQMASITFEGVPPANMAADSSLSLFQGAAADCSAQSNKLKIRYPYRLASAWDSVKGQSYGANNPTWTAYGTTALTANDLTETEGEFKVIIRSSDIPFKDFDGFSGCFGVDDQVPFTVDHATLSADKMSVTVTLQKIGEFESTQGTFTIACQTSALAAEIVYSNGILLSEYILPVNYNLGKVSVTANPSTVGGDGGQVQIELKIGLDSLPFNAVEAAKTENYFTSDPNYPVRSVEVGVDKTSVLLTIDRMVLEVEDRIVAITVRGDAFDWGGAAEPLDGWPDASTEVTFRKPASTYIKPELTVSPDAVTLRDRQAEVAVSTSSSEVCFSDISLENFTVTPADYKISKVETYNNNRSAMLTITDRSGSAKSGVAVITVDKAALEYTGSGNVSLNGGTVSVQITVPSDPPDNPDPPDVPDVPTNPDKPDDSGGSSGGGDKTGNTTPSTDKERIPLPEEIAVPPGEDPPSPVQDIVKKDKIYTEYVKWIERVEPPEFAADLYDVLVSGSDETDTRFADCLTEDKYFTIDPSADGKENADVETVEEVEFALSELYGSTTGGLSSVIFENDDFFIVNVTKGDRGVSYNQLTLGDVVQTSAYNGVFVVSIPKGQDYDAKKKEVCSYIAAVFQAFDRDHPEVFWLSGKCKVRIATVGGQAYFFLSLADAKGFTMRAPDWTAPGAVANGLRRRETAVQRILATVGSAGTSQEQLRALNRYLTEHNEYNTSADLNAIGNEPHECLAALEGRAGNSGPVCDGYARAFKVVCDRLNIPCVLENGYAKSSPGGGGTFHMWNSVELGGSWFGVDVTWNDPVVRGVSGAKSGHENERYFLVGANTDILGMAFAASHPVTNQAAVGGVAFDNGPALSPVAFSAMTHQSRNSVGAMEFQDVPIWEWFANCVAYACERGLMTGVSEERFAPNRNLSREMLWMILYRLDGNTSRELEDTRRWAVAQELSDGSAPLAAITREQMVTTLYRYCKRKGYRIAPGADLSRFPDSGRVEEYAREAFAWAVGCGLVGGTDEGLLAPQGYATRAQIAAILQRFEQCVK